MIVTIRRILCLVLIATFEILFSDIALATCDVSVKIGISNIKAKLKISSEYNGKKDAYEIRIKDEPINYKISNPVITTSENTNFICQVTVGVFNSIVEGLSALNVNLWSVFGQSDIIQKQIDSFKAEKLTSILNGFNYYLPPDIPSPGTYKLELDRNVVRVYGQGDPVKIQWILPKIATKVYDSNSSKVTQYELKFEILDSNNKVVKTITKDDYKIATYQNIVSATLDTSSFKPDIYRVSGIVTIKHNPSLDGTNVGSQFKFSDYTSYVKSATYFNLVDAFYKKNTKQFTKEAQSAVNSENLRRVLNKQLSEYTLPQIRSAYSYMRASSLVKKRLTAPPKEIYADAFNLKQALDDAQTNIKNQFDCSLNGKNCPKDQPNNGIKNDLLKLGEPIVTLDNDVLKNFNLQFEVTDPKKIAISLSGVKMFATAEIPYELYYRKSNNKTVLLLKDKVKLKTDFSLGFVFDVNQDLKITGKNISFVSSEVVLNGSISTALLGKSMVEALVLNTIRHETIKNSIAVIPSSSTTQIENIVTNALYDQDASHKPTVPKIFFDSNSDKTIARLLNKNQSTPSSFTSENAPSFADKNKWFSIANMPKNSCDPAQLAKPISKASIIDCEKKSMLYSFRDAVKKIEQTEYSIPAQVYEQESFLSCQTDKAAAGKDAEQFDAYSYVWIKTVDCTGMKRDPYLGLPLIDGSVRLSSEFKKNSGPGASDAFDSKKADGTYLYDPFFIRLISAISPLGEPVRQSIKIAEKKFTSINFTESDTGIYGDIDQMVTDFNSGKPFSRSATLSLAIPESKDISFDYNWDQMIYKGNIVTQNWKKGRISHLFRSATNLERIPFKNGSMDIKHGATTLRVPIIVDFDGTTFKISTDPNQKTSSYHQFVSGSNTLAKISINGLDGSIFNNNLDSLVSNFLNQQIADNQIGLSKSIQDSLKNFSYSYSYTVQDAPSSYNLTQEIPGSDEHSIQLDRPLRTYVVGEMAKIKWFLPAKYMWPAGSTATYSASVEVKPINSNVSSSLPLTAKINGGTSWYETNLDTSFRGPGVYQISGKLVLTSTPNYPISKSNKTYSITTTTDSYLYIVDNIDPNAKIQAEKQEKLRIILNQQLSEYTWPKIKQIYGTELKASADASISNMFANVKSQITNLFSNDVVSSSAMTFTTSDFITTAPAPQFDLVDKTKVILSWKGIKSGVALSLPIPLQTSKLSMDLTANLGFSFNLSPDGILASQALTTSSVNLSSILPVVSGSVQTNGNNNIAHIMTGFSYESLLSEVYKSLEKISINDPWIAGILSAALYKTDALGNTTPVFTFNVNTINPLQNSSATALPAPNYPVAPILPDAIYPQGYTVTQMINSPNCNPATVLPTNLVACQKNMLFHYLGTQIQLIQNQPMTFPTINANSDSFLSCKTSNVTAGPDVQILPFDSAQMTKTINCQDMTRETFSGLPVIQGPVQKSSAFTSNIGPGGTGAADGIYLYDPFLIRLLSIEYESGEPVRQTVDLTQVQKILPYNNDQSAIYGDIDGLLNAINTGTVFSTNTMLSLVSNEYSIARPYNWSQWVFKGIDAGGIHTHGGYNLTQTPYKNGQLAMQMGVVTSRIPIIVTYDGAGTLNIVLSSGVKFYPNPIHGKNTAISVSGLGTLLGQDLDMQATKYIDSQLWGF